MKILFISSKLFYENNGGGFLTRRNFYFLKECEQTYNVDLYILNSHSNFFKKLWNNLLGYKGGLNSEIRKDILKKISDNQYTIIFLDSSVLGKIAKIIKKEFPEIKIVTQFHNVEYDIWNHMLISKKLYLLNYLFLVPIKYNERLALRYSDKVLVLNQRDKIRLYKIYKIKDINYEIIPMSFADNFDNSKVIKNTSNEVKILLFVGSLFFSNYYGIKWFIDNVLPSLFNVKLKIVGKDFEKVRNKFSKNEKLEIIGSVDKLEKYYYESDLIISPIFDGSGMKTKIAEALMYGKSIIGTPESFQGFDLDFDKIGGVCNSAEEFITTITNVLKNEKYLKYNNYSRSVFLKRYSAEVVQKKFNLAISDI